jgi:hypothetical protein
MKHQIAIAVVAAALGSLAAAAPGRAQQESGRLSIHGYLSQGYGRVPLPTGIYNELRDSTWTTAW